YQGQHPAHKTVLLKDLFDLLEKVIDRCRDAGNVVTHIVLKNS
ncbi:MAG: pit accessory protein, partial [Planctomyces sp.]